MIEIPMNAQNSAEQNAPVHAEEVAREIGERAVASIIPISSAPSYLPRRKAFADEQRVAIHEELLQWGLDIEQRNETRVKEARRSRADALGIRVVSDDSH